MPNPIAEILVINGNYPNYEIEKEVLKRFHANITEITSDNLIGYDELLERADAILVREFPISKATIKRLKNCKVIVRYGVGVDNIDTKTARKQKIYVANVPDYGVEEVSDHALALLLSVSRRITKINHDVKQGIWDPGPNQPIYSFQNKTLGIVGYGKIGEAFCRKAYMLGFKEVLVHDPYFNSDIEYVKGTSIEELCNKADVISLHAPLTAETYHIINRDTLDLMKKTTIIINTSRGGLIDEAALKESLQKGQIFGAGLDVFENEPPLVDESFLRVDNVVLTNHIAWYSEESVKRLKEKAAQEIARVLAGSSPKFWVNRWEV